MAAPQPDVHRPEPDELRRLREAILDKLIAAVTALATVPVAAGIWLSIINNVPVIAVFDALCLLTLVFIWRARLPTYVRALVITLLPGLAGHVLLAVVGPLSLGAVWLGAVPSLAGVLFNRRAFWIALGGVVASMVVLWAAVHDTAPWISAGAPTPVAWWLTAASSIACVSSFVGLPATYLVSGLEQSLAAQERSREALRELATREASLHRQFEQLFARTPQALLLVAADGRIAQRNEAGRALFEAPGAAAPTTIGAIFDDAAVADAAQRAASVTKDGDGERVEPAHIGGARRADGAPLVVETQVVSIEIAGEHFALVGATDVAKRVTAERELSRALREKETLLQEVHHRVKNNLQVVSSLLSLQASVATTEASRAALEDSTHRVRTMALIHQQLYGGTDFSAIELGDYARTLVGALRGALDPRSELRLDLDTVHVALGQALQCGLILNELVTNAFKHGRGADGVCRVAITLRSQDAGFMLEVADAGQGFKEDWSTLRRRSLGAQIVESLVRQLRAKLEVASTTEGARFTVRCPLAPDVNSR
jgi:two-component sensor histidine kinase/PAS domain-containing protein